MINSNCIYCVPSVSLRELFFLIFFALPLAFTYLRSQHIHIDLLISKPLQDTDNDGLPDLWEEQYGLNINQPDDADIGMDGDGLSNLEEFNLASNPEVDNCIPSLRIDEMLIYEQGKVQFNPYILDSDTSSEDIWIAFNKIP
jgi:hypothetical protein